MSPRPHRPRAPWPRRPGCSRSSRRRGRPRSTRRGPRRPAPRGNCGSSPFDSVGRARKATTRAGGVNFRWKAAARGAFRRAPRTRGEARTSCSSEGGSVSRRPRSYASRMPGLTYEARHTAGVFPRSSAVSRIASATASLEGPRRRRIGVAAAGERAGAEKRSRPRPEVLGGDAASGDLAEIRVEVSSPHVHPRISAVAIAEHLGTRIGEERAHDARGGRVFDLPQLVLAAFARVVERHPRASDAHVFRAERREAVAAVLPRVDLASRPEKSAQEQSGHRREDALARQAFPPQVLGETRAQRGQARGGTPGGARACAPRGGASAFRSTRTATGPRGRGRSPARRTTETG